MKYKFSQRCEALGDLAYKNNRKIKTHKNIKKYKLVGYVAPYYKYPADAKGLWVTPEQWEIRTWLRYVPNVKLTGGLTAESEKTNERPE